MKIVTRMAPTGRDELAPGSPGVLGKKRIPALKGRQVENMLSPAPTGRYEIAPGSPGVLDEKIIPALKGRHETAFSLLITPPGLKTCFIANPGQTLGFIISGLRPWNSSMFRTIPIFHPVNPVYPVRKIGSQTGSLAFSDLRPLHLRPPPRLDVFC